jgi:homospermidine synthase
MVRFNGNILCIGYGSVAQCTLPILFQHIDVQPSSVTVMDFEDKSEPLSEWTVKGVKFVRDRVTRENLGSILSTYVKAGDIIIDLAWNIDCGEIVHFCNEHGVMYINTSVELWDPYAGAEHKHPCEKTLYHRHMNLRKLVRGWANKGTTAVIEHGANPGLISHWTKQGLLDIAERGLDDGKFTGALAEEITHHVRAREFNRLAMKMGVKVIHCSERDTQVTNVPKRPNEFVNTWSIEGFREEGTTTAEMGWGTHEKWLPPLTYTHSTGPRSQICLARMGMNTNVRSWVPGHCIVGMVVRHGEAFTITENLTVREWGVTTYRPTVHYAYCPCDAAIASLHELRGCDYELQPELRIMNDEITEGADILGALIMGHPYKSWWCGSDLSIEQSRRLVPGQNATTMQVAIGVVSALSWMIENPNEGLCVPDDLPYDYILNIARPYLGNNISIPSDWTPLTHYRNHFDGFNFPCFDYENPWSFKNFLITEGD